MKLISVILLPFILLFTTCTKSNDLNKFTLEKIIEREIESGIINNTIFLGFTFGMTKTDFNCKVDSLLKANKIYMDHTNRSILTYDLTIDKYTLLKCTFGPEYYDGKLYKLGVSAKSNSIASSVQLSTLNLAILFMEKYGIPKFEEEMQIIDKCKRYIWIDGNRKIEIMCGLEDSRILYEDLTVSSLIEESDKKDIENKARKSQLDI